MTISKKATCLILSLALFSGTAFAAVQVLAGISAISFAVARTITQNALKRGFTLSDPRVTAIPAAVQKALQDRVLQTMTGRQFALGLAGLTGGILAFQDGFEIKLDGQQITTNQDQQSTGVYIDGQFYPITSNSTPDSFPTSATNYNWNNFLDEWSTTRNFHPDATIKYFESNGNNILCIVNSNGDSLGGSCYNAGANVTGTTPTSIPYDQGLSLPSDVLGKPIDDAQLISLADQIFLEMASEEGYSGVPYSYSSPITSSDLSDANGDINNLTVSDFVNPSEINTDSQGNESIDQETVQQDQTQTQTDFGPDPGIGYNNPTTGDGITLMGPFIDMVVPAFNMDLPNAQYAQCPTYTIELDLLNTTLNFDSHCLFIEQNKAFIQTICLLMFAIATIRIFMSA